MYINENYYITTQNDLIKTNLYDKEEFIDSKDSRYDQLLCMYNAVRYKDKAMEASARYVAKALRNLGFTADEIEARSLTDHKKAVTVKINDKYYVKVAGDTVVSHNLFRDNEVDFSFFSKEIFWDRLINVARRRSISNSLKNKCFTRFFKAVKMSDKMIKDRLLPEDKNI